VWPNEYLLGHWIGHRGTGKWLSRSPNSSVMVLMWGFVKECIYVYKLINNEELKLAINKEFKGI
jgi:hypothetical protein